MFMRSEGFIQTDMCPCTVEITDMQGDKYRYSPGKGDDKLFTSK